MLAEAAVLLIRLYSASLRVRFHYHSDISPDQMEKALFAFWHGRQFLLVPFFGGRNIAIMTDLSWAGEIQTRILRRFGYHIVRGSSKRRSVRVLMQMKRAVEDGHAAAFAVDGPSGPIHVSKPGIVFLAEKLQHPVIPVACSASKAKFLQKTWCRYMLPIPFSRCVIAFGRPAVVQKGFSSGDLDILLLQWQQHWDTEIGLKE